MNPGIFISYSRNDEKQALHLLSVLRREGYSVWIDQEAIAGASIWSDEIVQNIKRSDIFVALLSSSSTSSANVSKEIALAAEHGKIILPVEIGKVTLPGALEYALAGIQRTSFHDEEAILRAVRSQVARLEGQQSGNPAEGRLLTRSKRIRQAAIVSSAAAVVLAAALVFLFHRSDPAVPSMDTVAVLPFSTLNLDRDSTHNLDIFSDAILARLAALKSVSVFATSASLPYRNSPLNPLAVAKELKARFVVSGLVRKTHDVNFISVRIVDARQGGEIWEQSYTGSNSELFPLRNRISDDLSGYLKGTISDERELGLAEANLKEHPSDAAAYARLGAILTGTDKTRAFNLYERAIALDSSNVSYALGAGIVAERIGADSRPFGELAAGLCERTLRQFPDSLPLRSAYAIGLDLAGKNIQAEAEYDALLKVEPKNIRVNYNAACCFAKQGKADTAVAILRKLFVFAPGKRHEAESDPDFDNIRSMPQYQELMYGAAPQ